MNAQPILSVVTPCYDEREGLPEFMDRLRPVLEETTGGRYEVIFVDDGSSDGTGAFLDSLAASDPRLRVLHLSRNFGHQAALSAGLDVAAGQAVVLMDSDLQDPPEVIPAFVAEWKAGAEVAYGVRRQRREGFLKKAAYAVFYRSMRLMADVDMPLEAGDFCLMDRRVVEVVIRLPERDRFLRGLRAWAGFRQVGVPFPRGERQAGEAKYTFRKLVSLALSGYLGFSILPLRLASLLGLLAAGVGFLLALWVIVVKLAGVTAPQGWASTVSLELLSSGVMLLVLGVIGEYLGRIYNEVRQRPTYVVRDRRGFEGSDLHEAAVSDEVREQSRVSSPAGRE